MIELTLFMAIIIMFIAFFCEYTDSTLGMGYGTTLTPVLLLMGFSVMQIVPVVLISELISGATAGFFHHKEGNINFKKPENLKITSILGLCGVLGSIVAVNVSLNLPKFWVKMYIGCLVLSIGIFMLIFLNKKLKFSWKKITGIGLLASFNKGISGGGYGTLVCPAQILSGVKSKQAVAITSVSESITCLAGILVYLLIAKKQIDLTLAPFIITGAILSHLPNLL